MTSTGNLSIGEILRRARRAYRPKMSQRALGRKAQISPSYPGLVEAGEIQQPSEEYLNAMARALGHSDAAEMIATYGTGGASEAPARPTAAEGSLDDLRRAYAELRAETQAQIAAIKEAVAKRVAPIVGSLPPVPAVPTVPPFIVIDSGTLHFGEGSGGSDEPVMLPNVPESLRDRYTAFQARGDCMEPFVKHGWWVVIDKAAPRAAGQMVAVQLPGEGLSARWYMPKNGHVEFVARTGEPVVMERADAANAIYGAVVQIGVPPVDAWHGMEES